MNQLQKEHDEAREEYLRRKKAYERKQALGAPTRSENYAGRNLLQEDNDARYFVDGIDKEDLRGFHIIIVLED